MVKLRALARAKARSRLRVRAKVGEPYISEIRSLRLCQRQKWWVRGIITVTRVREILEKRFDVWVSDVSEAKLEGKMTFLATLKSGMAEVSIYSHGRD